MADVDKTIEWVGAAAEVPGDVLAEAATIVFEGSAVAGTVDQIAARLATARVLALLRDAASGRIVGVAAIKDPSADYRRRTFTKAGVAITTFGAAPELGYVVIAQAWQGLRLSGQLVHSVLAGTAPPIYATTDDATMKKNLARAGFLRVGDEWKGRRDSLSLWILEGQYRRTA